MQATGGRSCSHFNRLATGFFRHGQIQLSATGKNILNRIASHLFRLGQPSGANSMQPQCCVSFVSVFLEPTKKDSAKIDVSPYGEPMDDIGLEPTTLKNNEIGYGQPSSSSIENWKNRVSPRMETCASKGNAARNS